MKRLTLLLVLISFGMSARAQSDYKKDVEAIKAMCGCFHVKFNFSETFAAAKDYEFSDNYLSSGLEFVFPVEDRKGKISLQHLLIVADSIIIKHWRQDWIYENTDLYVFHSDNTWMYTLLDKEGSRGQWTQKVYQVDDSPRYEGSATWVHVDGRHFWEGTADAPLPRREFSQRDDYNVMVRRNRQEITTYGWVHEQDNDKVIRGDSDRLLASEKGWNTYNRVNEESCNAAREWWETHQVYWADVRSVWEELFALKEDIKIRKKVDDRVLFQSLFSLEKELLGADYNSATARVQIRETIQRYLASGQILRSAAP